MDASGTDLSETDAANAGAPAAVESILSSPRLILRPFCMEDLPAVVAFSNRPEFHRFFPVAEQTPESAEEFLRSRTQERRPNAAGNWIFAVERKTRAGAIGTIRIRGPLSEHRDGDVGCAFNALFARGVVIWRLPAREVVGARALRIHP